jgi:hypothetical protein
MFFSNSFSPLIDGTSLLQHKANQANAEVVQVLLDVSPQALQAKTMGGDTPLHAGIQRNAPAASLALLLKVWRKGSHACWLAAGMRVANRIPLGVHFLTSCTIKSCHNEVA